MRMLLPVVFFCAVVFGEDGMVAIKSNQPDTIVQEYKEVMENGKQVMENGKPVVLWVNIGVTPADGSYLMLKMPIGKHKIRLSKFRYLTFYDDIIVDNVIKKVSYELKEEYKNINIIFLPEGWQVYVDSEPCLNDDKPIFAPATIRVSKGKHEIRLVKDGYNDIVKNVNDEDTVEIKDEPVRGVRTIVKKDTKLAKDESVAWALGDWTLPNRGVWSLSYENNQYNLTMRKNNHYSLGYIIIDNNLIFKWSNGNDVIVFSKEGKETIVKCYSKYLNDHDLSLPDEKSSPIWSSKAYLK